jgi:hypothetical protein
MAAAAIKQTLQSDLDIKPPDSLLMWIPRPPVATPMARAIAVAYREANLGGRKSSIIDEILLVLVAKRS